MHDKVMSWTQTGVTDACAQSVIADGDGDLDL